MLNQVVMVGRLIEDPKLETKGDKSFANFSIAIPRSYKNENGEYETDFINFFALENVAKTATEYCKKGDILGVKGRVQGNGETLEIIAEKITFLSSAKNEGEEEQ